MLQYVRDVKSLIANVKEYQRAPKESRKATPSLVYAWYYIPVIDRVGPSRFIGYQRMTTDLYDESDEVDGRKTERHLRRKGWFRLLEESDHFHGCAVRAAQELAPRGRVRRNARFYVLDAME